jgi:origin recognition complex subunit 1
MAKSVPTTPSRRSQRFQPTASPTKGIDKNILECFWAGEPVFVRETIPEIDLLPEEQEEGNRGSEDTDTDGESERLSETVFYDAFRMRRKATAYRGSKSMKLGKTETVTYKVGDTVMVETDTLYIMKRPPSIGVVVAMWETRKEEDSDTLTDPSRMRIRIHWFLRPTELASIRAKREYKEVSYYPCCS